MPAFTSGFPYHETFDTMDPKPGGFDMRVICCKNVPPRDPRFEYVSEVGYAAVTRLFAHKDHPVKIQPSEDHISIMFPERYLSVHEQRWLGTALEEAGYKRADVISSSVFIVQSASCLSIIQDDKYLEDRKAEEWWFGKAFKQRVEW